MSKPPMTARPREAVRVAACASRRSAQRDGRPSIAVTASAVTASIVAASSLASRMAARSL